MIPAAVQQVALDFLSARQERPVALRSTKPVSGGDINAAYQLQTDVGDYFIKVNQAKAFPGMFEAEARGLKLLDESKVIPVPQALTTGEVESHSFFLAPWVKAARRTDSFWELFGEALAHLHQQSGSYFGLDHSNYIGSLPQSNTPHDSWAEFFITQRLEAQLRLARDNSQIDGPISRAFDRLFGQMDSLFPEEPPALLHGDLWSGNFMVNERGEACLIDPAVYYGHREMDMGMTRLFGGFDAAFYRSYQDTYPLEQGWEERLEVANLYPLLVHVNLFGGGYLQQVMSVLKRHT